MAEIKSYVLGSATISELGQSVEAFLRGQGGMEVEGMAGSGGYLVQARQNSGEWRKFVGLDKAIQVQITPAGAGMVSVDIGQAKWVDKLGVAAVGALVFAPLVVVAGLGAVSQVRLIAEVQAHIAAFLSIHGGRPS